MEWKVDLKALILVAWALGLSACTTFTRDPRSGYADSDSPLYRATDFYNERAEYQESQAKEEFGWNEGRTLTEAEQQALELRLRLTRLESRLETGREKRQYYQIKGQMKNDEERIWFLSLPSLESRERWARNRGLLENDGPHSEEKAALIEKNDIAVGMSQKEVNESWGDPDVVEVAGNPVYGNERWRYSRYISSSDGYQQENRIIYFEAGRVAGWETQ